MININVIISLMFMVIINGDKLDVDIENIIVYGPGLSPDKIVFPVRYFFIELYDSKGKRITKGGDKSSFTVQIEGETPDGAYCRVWTQILDRNDGSYIVRYRTYQTCLKPSIFVLYHGKHVAKSPYRIEDPVYAEDCYCPVSDTSEWQTLVGCDREYANIQKDLHPFHDVNFDSVLAEASIRFNQSGSRSFCNYVVKDNQVYRKCYGQHVGFSMFMDNLLHTLTRKMVLPDLEFISNLGDWPLVDPKQSPLLPIFSWCGSEDTADIVMPTYEIVEATIEMMGRVTLDLLSVQSNNDIAWIEKKPMAFWRGRDSSRERLHLVELARENEQLFNVSLTNFFFFKEEQEKFGPKADHVSFFSFFDYKYQLNLDGTVAAYRFPYLLGGGSVVFKQESPYYEFFYPDLKPFVHYIPFKRDLSDLVEKIEWAIGNDEKSLEISHNARQYVQENLMPKDIYCYHVQLFKEWSKRLSSEVQIREGMEHIPTPQNEKRFGNCRCHRLPGHDEL